MVISEKVICEDLGALTTVRQFQEDAKDASVSECTWTLSALEALRNALYKFKTYLLTSKRVLDLFEPVKLMVWKVVIEIVTVIKYRMDNGGGNGAGIVSYRTCGMVITCVLFLLPTQNPYFKVRPFFYVEYLRNG